MIKFFQSIILGALLGAVIGAVSVLLFAEGPPDGAIMGAVVGAIVGAFFGARMETHRFSTRYERVHPVSAIRGKEVPSARARVMRESYRGPVSGAANPNILSEIDRNMPAITDASVDPDRHVKDKP